jgi:hypothetical protein
VHTVHVLYAGLGKASVEIRKLGRSPEVPGGRIHSQITQNRPFKKIFGTNASIGTAAFIVTAASSAGLGYLEVM